VVVAALLSILLTACDSQRDDGGAPQTPAPAKSTGAAGEPVFSFDGYGAIRIGMSKPEVLAASLVPLAVYGNGRCTWLYDKRVADANGNPAQSVQITLDRHGMVTHVDAYAATDARTDRGVKAGSSLSDVLAVYPEPSRRTRTQAPDVLVVSGSANDLSFALDEAQRVVGIAIGERGYAIGSETCSGS
jgi:hypothetical protein